MGLLNFFGKSSPTLLALPLGSFTVDREGGILASTVPSAYPQDKMRELAKKVLGSFSAAHNAGLQLSEITVNYHGFRITARELRGGAVVFLAPVETGAGQNLT